MNTRQRYAIQVAGHLRDDWEDWFEGLSIERQPAGTSSLSGMLDQAGLHGVLQKLRDLGLRIIAVNLCAGESGKDGVQ